MRPAELWAVAELAAPVTVEDTGYVPLAVTRLYGDPTVTGQDGGLVVPVAGWYQVTGTFGVEGSATGATVEFTRNNGTAPYPYPFGYHPADQIDVRRVVDVAAPLALDAGDVVQCLADSKSGSIQFVVGRFWLQFLGPLGP
jgi:hypothetical protein